MEDKLIQLFALINANRSEIADVQRSGEEYYFQFRNRVFSVLENDAGAAFYVYPKWTGTPQELVVGLEHGLDNASTTYLYVNHEQLGDRQAISSLWSWLQSKFVGLDDLLRDVGL